jgi:hypothetical protein
MRTRRGASCVRNGDSDFVSSAFWPMLFRVCAFAKPLKRQRMPHQTFAAQIDCADDRDHGITAGEGGVSRGSVGIVDGFDDVGGVLEVVSTRIQEYSLRTRKSAGKLKKTWRPRTYRRPTLWVSKCLSWRFPARYEQGIFSSEQRRQV